MSLQKKASNLGVKIIAPNITIQNGTSIDLTVKNGEIVLKSVTFSNSNAPNDKIIIKA